MCTLSEIPKTKKQQLIEPDTPIAVLEAGKTEASAIVESAEETKNEDQILETEPKEEKPQLRELVKSACSDIKN